MTLKAALEMIQEYEWTGQYHTLAVMRLQQCSEDNPRALRSEASRIRNAFYAYSVGFNYGQA